MTTWKNKSLNKLGRITLAKLVMNYPFRHTTLFGFSFIICSQTDLMTTKIIWKDFSNKGIHLVGWNVVTQAKKDGSLGLRIVRYANTIQSCSVTWLGVYATKTKQTLGLYSS
jgi:hypothetical protein